MADQVSAICHAAYYQLSSVSCVQWPGAWHQRRPRQQYRHSSVVSTIVTPYCMTSLTTYCNDFSPSRMQQLAWWLDPAGQTISHQSCDGSTGCLWGDISSLSWLCSYTSRYLSDDCQLVSDVGRHRLRSSDVSTCVVPRTHTGFGIWAFKVAGPRLWNSLPASLRQSDTSRPVQETAEDSFV